MFSKRFVFLIVVISSLMMVFGTGLSSQRSTKKLHPPEFSGEFQLKMVRNIIQQGYDLLEGGNLEGALAKFEGIDKLVQSKWLSTYHKACAYARTENNKKGLEQLELIIDNGFDYPDKLESDPNLESLRTTPDFDKLIKQARKNYKTGTAALVKGLPEYEDIADEFESEEQLTTWSRDQDRLHYKHRNIWTATELLTAQVNMRARYLAALKTFKRGDPEFDYGLERVKASIHLKSLARPGWGIVADLVRHEVDTYTQSSPPADALGEANFFAGMVLSLKYKYEDPRRVDAYGLAAVYLEKVEQDHQYHGAAQVLRLVNELQSPHADRTAIGGKLGRIIEAFPDNNDIYTIISTRLNHNAASILWPLPIDVPDIDGQNVSLSEYRGKVVLIDFWAITCAPCRRELPGIVEVYDKYHDKGFEIISVSLDSKDRTNVPDMRRWTAKNKMKWRHIYDGTAWKSILSRRFFVGSIPAPYLVGPDGSLAAWGDACHGKNLEQNVQKALAKSAD